MVIVIDRARRDLLGTSPYSVGIDSGTNRDGKNSNPDLRYLTSSSHARTKRRNDLKTLLEIVTQ